MSTSTSFTELDFTALKNSLINFLRSQAQFKDYDFTGSDLSVLLDVLSKNTEKGAFYTNMALSESFLDSAQLRSSVTSQAKPLNYTPRSRRSSKARIRVEFNASSVSQPYIIQKGQSFSTLIKNDAFVFTIPETITVASANNSFVFETDIFEGIFVKDSYVFVSDDVTPFPHFPITNPNVDTSSLSVVVFEDGNEVGDTYKQTQTLLGVNESSKVFFLQCGPDGNYEVMFGDGILGRVPKQNALIVLDYRVSNASRANGAAVFAINFDPTGPSSELTGGVNNPKVTTIIAAAAGAEVESLESIRYYAPRAFQVQERAVAPNDYAILLKTNFPEIHAVDVYGGEEENPPLFRNVIISVSLDGITGLPDSKRQEYTDYIKTRNPLAIVPIFKDPIFTYIHIDTLVRYNVNISPNSKEFIKTLVADTISQYNNKNLDDFNVTFRYSPFIRAIDQTDASIISNITAIQLYKKTQPNPGATQTMLLSFGVPLASGQIDEAGALFSFDSIVNSSLFTFKGEQVVIKDDGRGGLFIVRRNAKTFSPIQQTGIVDYETGQLTISNFNPDNYVGDFLKVFVRPRDVDVKSAQRNILSIESDEVSILVEELRT